ncbi:hypothetical protein EDD86DRAFT_208560 [Gorgonomyces haynaldii]|nr:hypothetical protein EDD86DRAFT_208560 [Gorgonomyces haynaldii]
MLEQVVGIVQSWTDMDVSELSNCADLLELKNRAQAFLSDDLQTRLNHMLLQYEVKTEEVDTNHLHRERVSIVQRAPDGSWLFSNSQDQHLVTDVKTTKIKLVGKHANPPNKSGKLGAAAHPLPLMLTRKPKMGIQIRPADVLDHGPFSSFAPGTDSSRAALSSGETNLILNMYRHVELLPFDKESLEPETVTKIYKGEKDDKLPTLPVTGEWAHPLVDPPKDVVFDPESLKKISPLNWQAILDLPEKIRKLKQGEHPNQVLINNLLAENAELVFNLQQFQNERFEHNKPTITPQEKEMATKLHSNLAALLKWTPIGELASREQIEDAMKMLPIFKSGYQGTLPLKKNYAFPSNNGGRNAFTVDAGSLPAEVHLAKKQKR